MNVEFVSIRPLELFLRNLPVKRDDTLSFICTRKSLEIQYMSESLISFCLLHFDHNDLIHYDCEQDCKFLVNVTTLKKFICSNDFERDILKLCKLENTLLIQVEKIMSSISFKFEIPIDNDGTEFCIPQNTFYDSIIKVDNNTFDSIYETLKYNAKDDSILTIQANENECVLSISNDPLKIQCCLKNTSLFNKMYIDIQTNNSIEVQIQFKEYYKVTNFSDNLKNAEIRLLANFPIYSLGWIGKNSYFGQYISPLLKE